MGSVWTNIWNEGFIKTENLGETELKSWLDYPYNMTHYPTLIS